MLIGELSNKTGLSRDTIRFYEKQGLINAGKKQRRENNYKEYSDNSVRRLLLIKHIKGFGFTLNETAGLLDMIETNTASCSVVSKQVAGKVAIIDQKINELEQIKSMMLNLVSSCCQPGPEVENCPSISAI